MKTSAHIGALLLGFAVISSCQKNELTDTNSFKSDLAKDLLNSDLSQRKGRGTSQEECHDTKIGSLYGGGIIFYIDESGRHGLIAALEDVGTAEWGCMGNSIPGTAIQIGTGQENTLTILAACKEPLTAAKLSDSWVYKEKKGKPKRHNNKERNDDKRKKYDDWFLPSFIEGHLLIETIHILKTNDVAYLDLVYPNGYCLGANLGQIFPFGNYWTSSQGDSRFMGTAYDGATIAWILKYSTDSEPYQIAYSELKSFKAQVRPIRAF